MATVVNLDWSVTEEKVKEAVRRIVEVANPLQVIAFGSRARGEQREDSDLDLAVILEESVNGMAGTLYATALRGVGMSVDLVVKSKAEYDLDRPWLNDVCNYIDREGILLYDRTDTQSSRAEAFHLVGSGRVGTRASAA
jgi:predicted nucleotidyltransferase